MSINDSPGKNNFGIFSAFLKSNNGKSFNIKLLFFLSLFIIIPVIFVFYKLAFKSDEKVNKINYSSVPRSYFLPGGDGVEVESSVVQSKNTPIKFKLKPTANYKIVTYDPPYIRTYTRIKKGESFNEPYSMSLASFAGKEGFLLIYPEEAIIAQKKSDIKSVPLVEIPFKILN